MKRIAIIGAGIAGLTAANLLKDHASITLFEKARGVSGRTSTRRAEPYFFDHGAQYFTARSEAFRQFIAPLIARALIARWNARHVTIDGTNIIAEHNWAIDEPRYVGIPGMNHIAKHLAKGLNIKIATRVAHLQHAEKWQLYGDDNTVLGEFDWVIVTAPAPQAAELLPVTFAYHDVISTTKMRACYALMLGYKTPLHLDFDAAHVQNSDISWIAINSSKPSRAKEYTLMVHSSEEYAESHIDDDRDAVADHLRAEASRIIGHDLNHADYQTIHGWKYANNTTREPLPTLIDTKLKLAACGDWCQGGRVEGAFTSAYALATQLKGTL